MLTSCRSSSNRTRSASRSRTSWSICCRNSYSQSFCSFCLPPEGRMRQDLFFIRLVFGWRRRFIPQSESISSASSLLAWIILSTGFPSCLPCVFIRIVYAATRVLSVGRDTRSARKKSAPSAGCGEKENNPLSASHCVLRADNPLETSFSRALAKNRAPGSLNNRILFGVVLLFS